MCPIAPDVIWAMDFQFDQISDGGQLKFLNVVDEFTRERLAIEVERSIGAHHVVRVLERLAREVRPALRAFRQWARNYRTLRRLVPFQRHRHALHRPRLALAEPNRRIIQRATTR